SSYAGQVVPLSPRGETCLAIAVVGVLAAIHGIGVKPGAFLLRGLTALKLILISVMVGWGFASARGDWAHFVPFAARPKAAPPLVEALAGAMVAAFFSFSGWWDAAKMAGEVRDPQRTLPRALLLGVGVVTATYILIAASFLYLIPVSAISTDHAFAA